MKIKKFNSFLNETIENEKRLSESIIDILNEQIKDELESSQIYKAMSCWLDNNGWKSASEYFFISANEELIHMDKIYKYLFSRNCVAKVPSIGEVEQNFKDIKEVIEKSLEHEMEVSKKWNNISELAKKEKDNTTYEFSTWYLNEQVEEEEKFRDILDKINLDMPKFEIENLFQDLLNKK